MSDPAEYLAENQAAFESLDGEIDEEKLCELAALSPIEYDRQRKAAANELGIGRKTLDDEVRKRRPSLNTNETDPLFLVDPEPWPDPVDGVALLSEIAVTFSRYCVLPEGAATVLALWTVFTHAHDAMRISPVLGISSPEKRCGKTTVLSVLMAISRRPLPAANITPAALFRATEKFSPTLLIDEADTFLRDNDELRGVLNSGHVRSMAKVVRTVGDDYDAQPFSTWAPKAIALIGKLPGTLADRAIVIAMRRKRPDEKTEALRLDRIDELEPIQRRAARWAADNLDAIREADPEVPGNLHDRAADNWRSLLMIAEVVGGQWPQRVRRAAVLLATESEDDDWSAQLLGDIRELLDHWPHPHIASATLVDRLIAMEDRLWSEWRRGKPMTPAGLSRVLGKYGIVSRSVRVSGASATAKGYPVDAFEDAFSRYLPSIPSYQNGTPAQASAGAGCAGFKSGTPDPDVPFSKAAQTNAGAGCAGVPFSSPRKGGNGAYTTDPTCPKCAGEGCSWCVDPATEAAL